MTDNLPDEPAAEEAQPADESEAQESHEADVASEDEESEVEAEDDLDVDEIEQELLDAMKKLRRTNKNIEEYLDGIAREAEQPAPEQKEPPAE
jgi:hypothetical protein